MIDGVDQLDWLDRRRRELRARGLHVLDGPELYGVKWRNFKLVLVAQNTCRTPPAKLPTPRLINLVTDPHEREAVALPHLHSWAATHFNRIIGEFQASVRVEPPIPAGAPLDHVPARTG